MSPPRILLAGLYHETNTFADDRTGLDTFDIRRGAEILALRENGSPLGAFISFAEKSGWSLVPIVDYRAHPSGTVLDDVIEGFWNDFEAQARPALESGVDAIFLVLHGAMVSESLEDVEGAILERIRALPGAGKIPLFGVTDLHANFTERMARHASMLVTYRKNPHTDAAETAIRAARLLAVTLGNGRIPRTLLRRFPIVWPPTGTATSDSPLRELEEVARRLETQGHLSVNIYAGFALADTRDTGASAAVADHCSDEVTQAALDELEAVAWQHREKGLPPEWDLETVLDTIASSPVEGPVLLVEPADNIGGGAPGDCTTILRSFVRRRVDSAGLILNDPAAVQELSSVQPGEKRRLSLGGKGSRLDPGPLELEIELIRRTDGVFDLEDPYSHLASMIGSQIDMGPCAVVRHGSITLLLTSRKTPPFDLGQWRSQGIDPESLRLISVKAAVAHRRAYDKIAAASYTVQTPGPCSSQLAALPFRKLRRPIFPLDFQPIPS